MIMAKVENVLALNEARREVERTMYELLYDVLNDADTIETLNIVHNHMKEIINTKLADDMKAAGLIKGAI